MTTFSGTISTGNDSDLYTVLDGALTGVGLSLVDTVVISTRTHKVYKNPAANNSLGVDWYLDIGYPTTGQAGITIRPFEFYDPATHLGYRGPVVPATFTPESTYYSRYGATGSALETNWLTSSTNFQIITSAASYGYRLSVTKDRIAGMTSNSPTTLIYAGLIDLSTASSAAAGASAFPLVCISGSTVYQTRWPKCTVNLSSSSGSSVSALPTSTPFPSGDTTTLPAYTRVVPVTISGSATTEGVGVEGFLKDVHTLSCAASVAHGDTFTENSGADTFWIAANNAAGAKYAVKQV